MASHQQRRAPLPADYQFPTHGVDCDCPPCRNQVVARVCAASMSSMFADVETKWREYRRRVDEPWHVEEPTAETPWGV